MVFSPRRARLLLLPPPAYRLPRSELLGCRGVPPWRIRLTARPAQVTRVALASLCPFLVPRSLQHRPLLPRPSQSSSRARCDGPARPRCARNHAGQAPRPKTPPPCSCLFLRSVARSPAKTPPAMGGWYVRCWPRRSSVSLSRHPAAPVAHLLALSPRCLVDLLSPPRWVAVTRWWTRRSPTTPTSCGLAPSSARSSTPGR
jgi:hypothetical protein